MIIHPRTSLHGVTWDLTVFFPPHAFIESLDHIKSTVMRKSDDFYSIVSYAHEDAAYVELTSSQLENFDYRNESKNVFLAYMYVSPLKYELARTPQPLPWAYIHTCSGRD